MEEFKVNPIGVVKAAGGEYCLRLDKRYAPALQGLDGFSHINILWWFSGCDNKKARATLTEESPYKGSPEVMGNFATRSPQRPNPIALSCAGVTYIDHENAVIGLAYIDADDGTPVLDIKPYTPSLDRVDNPSVPAWCANWPKSCEASAAFDWASVFNF